MDKYNTASNCKVVYTIASKRTYYSIIPCIACVCPNPYCSILDLELVNLVLAVP